ELNSKLKLMRNLKLEPGIAMHVAATVNWYEGDISIIHEDLMNCVSQPPQPSDLKPRKVSMRIAGGSRKKTKEVPDLEEFAEELEDELTEQGLAELEEEDTDLLETEFGEKPDGFI
ncbi:MAG TPA: hypothetical protein VM577_06090, partial [Anaerovoracaceae bacterium]|nr:hypothetical protein [Anaerovoracaceae bacterium]